MNVVNLPIPDALNVVYAACGVAAFWLGWAKYLGPKLKAKWNWFIGIFQSIAGRDPIVDKRTGEEIAPAVPAIGKQLASIHEQFIDVNSTMQRLVAVIESNQDAHARIDGVERRVDRHDEAIALLAGATVEKAALHKENAAFFDMISKRDSDVVDEPTD